MASYRQTVLTAFQQVEDELAALQILKHHAAAQATAVTAAQQALNMTLDEYSAGTVAYTSVITQQELLLTNQQTALSIQQSRLLARVVLVQGLGERMEYRPTPDNGGGGALQSAATPI